MTFGWYGFEFDHSEDWAPVALSGNRQVGYVRLSSSTSTVLQVRWKALKPGATADRFLNTYLAKLEIDAKKRKKGFSSEQFSIQDYSGYRYSGISYGEGALFAPAGDGRVFVVEFGSDRPNPLRRSVEHLLPTFKTDPERDRWSMFGLDFSLPKNLAVEKKEFVAGKTRLTLVSRGVKVLAERWGFADQLLNRYSLRDWASSILQTKDKFGEECEQGLLFRAPRSLLYPGFEAIAAHQPDRNQLVVVKSISRLAKWSPEWTWLN